MSLPKLFLDLISSFPLKVESQNCVNQDNIKVCERCVEVCPHGAIELVDNRPRVDFERCSVCGLCFAECPVRVFEVEFDLTELYTEKRNLLLGCHLSDLKGELDFKLPCLALLNGEILASLALHHGGKIVLDTSKCKDCPQRELLNSILSHLEEAKLLLHYHRGEGEVLQLSEVENVEDLKAENEVSELFEEEKPKPNLSRKINVPLWRQLFFERVKLLDPSEVCYRPTEEKKLRFATVSIDGQLCKRNDVCSFWCPTKALSADQSAVYFTQILCTDCGLCEEICPGSAITLEKRFVPRYNVMGAKRVVGKGERKTCKGCGKEFVGPPEEEYCLYCRKEREMENLIKLFLEGKDGQT